VVFTAKQGKIICEESFGYVDKEKNERPTPYFHSVRQQDEDRYAIIKLAEQNLIHLDSPVNIPVRWQSAQRYMGCCHHLIFNLG
jgi:heat shock protein HspQ